MRRRVADDALSIATRSDFSLAATARSRRREVGTLEAMTLLVVAGTAAFCVIAAGAVAWWTRRHRARRDLEGHFQNEWVNQQRWASLDDGEAGPSPGVAAPPEAIRTEP